MVIYDTKNNYEGRIRGMLYLSLMDVDYLLKKYGEEELKKRLPNDYVDHFINELALRNGYDIISVQYYPVLNVGIETEADEELLKLIKEEVKQGNLYTKSTLVSIPKEELTLGINALKPKTSLLNNEELYKLRSYMLSVYAQAMIDKANSKVQIGYETGYYSGEEFRQIVHDLKAIGASSEIEESDYFSNVRQ